MPHDSAQSISTCAENRALLRSYPSDVPRAKTERSSERPASYQRQSSTRHPLGRFARILFATTNLIAVRFRIGRSNIALLLTWIVIQGLANVLMLWKSPANEADKNVPKNIIDQYESRTLRQIDFNSCELMTPYRLLKPRQIEGKLPLVVFLHGAGQRGVNNVDQLRTLPEQMVLGEWRQRFPCYLVAPQCPVDSHWTQPDQLKAIMLVIEETIRDQPSIDQARIYLTGLSMGGFGSWSLAASHPKFFAAVVPICGGGQPNQAFPLTNTPIWAVHGDADNVVPVDGSREMIEAIRATGGHPHYTELKGVGHNCWSQTYQVQNEVMNWMFSQSSAPIQPSVMPFSRAR